MSIQFEQWHKQEALEHRAGPDRRTGGPAEAMQPWGDGFAAKVIPVLDVWPQRVCQLLHA